MGQTQPQFIKGGVQRISSPIYQLNENNRPFWVMILIFPSISLLSLSKFHYKAYLLFYI